MRYLGIEIGGTKLQVGVGTGNGPPLLAIRRMEVDRSKGAEAIRRHILELARPLIAQYHPEAIGIAFGGPIDAAKGRTLPVTTWPGGKSFLWSNGVVRNWASRLLWETMPIWQVGPKPHSGQEKVIVPSFTLRWGPASAVP